MNRQGPRTGATVAVGSIGIPAYLGLAYLSYLQHGKAAQTSSLLVLYLFGTIPMDALRARTLLHMSDGRSEAITVIALGAAKFCALVLEMWWKCPLALRNEACKIPEESDGLIERALMFRMLPIFTTGYRIPLEAEHLFKIDKILSFGRLGSSIAPRMLTQDLPPS